MTATWDCPQRNAAELLDWVHGQMAGAKHVEGVARPTPDTLDVTSAMIPAWAVVLAVLLFPIGLLFLIARDRRVLHVRAESTEAGTTRLHFVGGTTPGVVKAMVSMWHALFPASEPASA